MLAKLHHPRLLTLMAICDEVKGADGRETVSGRAIVTELMELGSLYTVLHHPASGKAVISTLVQRLQIALDIAEGMRFLHASHLIHRDLKSGNVLMGPDLRCKICDFGLSKFKDSTLSLITAGPTVGTPAWTAPELLREEQASNSSDVYSYGVILWEVFTGLIPWEGKSMFQIINQVASLNKTLKLPPVCEDCPLKIVEIMQRCFEVSPSRPSFKELCREVIALTGTHESSADNRMVQIRTNSLLRQFSYITNSNSIFA